MEQQRLAFLQYNRGSEEPVNRRRDIMEEACGNYIQLKKDMLLTEMEENNAPASVYAKELRKLLALMEFMGDCVNNPAPLVMVREALCSFRDMMKPMLDDAVQNEQYSEAESYARDLDHLTYMINHVKVS